MAIFNAVPPPEALTSGQQAQAHAPPTQAPFEIDAWTMAALQSLSVSPVARGTGAPLAIPIDQHPPPGPEQLASFSDAAAREAPRRPPSSRDSQRRREALLEGNQGSRQSRRWENGASRLRESRPCRLLTARCPPPPPLLSDRLVGVPNVQPPLPSDWEVRPTHPVHRTPYQLAQFWDRGIRQRVEDRAAALQAARIKQQRKAGSATGLGVGKVPRDLRESAKRSPAIRSWIRALEEPVRRYLVSEQVRSDALADDSAAEDMDSDDEEIVFVGRSGATRELGERRQAGYRRAWRQVEQKTVDSGVVFDSFGDGERAAFQCDLQPGLVSHMCCANQGCRRWLAHSISDYYGLASHSVTLANPTCRVVYVGLRQAHQRSGPPLAPLPRPLWEAC